jgi:hypothetical protein
MNVSKVSALLWTVNLGSISASVFSYVYLAYFIYIQTDIVLYSNLVLLAPMLVPVLFCFTINRYAKSASPKNLLALANIAGLCISVVTFLTIKQFAFAALVGAMFIGLIDATQRVTRMVAIKSYFSEANVKYAVPLTLTAQFIAGGIAGALMSCYKGQMTPEIAMLVVASLYILATIASIYLPHNDEGAQASTNSKMTAAETLAALSSILKNNSTLKQQFISFTLFVSIFQGFFYVSRVTLPTYVLHLSDQFVGLLQIISSMSALIGAILFYYLNKKGWNFTKTITKLISITSLAAMMGATLGTSVLSSYILYFIFMFLFEVLFFKYQADVVNACPKEHMPMISTFQYAAAYIGMMLVIFWGGVITQTLDLSWAAAVCVLLYLAIMLKEAVSERDLVSLEV